MSDSFTPDDGLPVVECPDRAAWRAWLERHHALTPGAWLVFIKKGVGEASVGYRDAVLEALCFGWIDSTVKRLDDARFFWREDRKQSLSERSGMLDDVVFHAVEKHHLRTEKGVGQRGHGKCPADAAAEDAAGPGQALEHVPALDEESGPGRLPDGAGVVLAEVTAIQSMPPQALSLTSEQIEQALSESLRTDRQEYFVRAVEAAQGAGYNPQIIEEVFTRLTGGRG